MVSSDESTDGGARSRPRLNSMVVRVATSESDSDSESESESESQEKSSSGGGGRDGRRRGSSEEVDGRKAEEKPVHAGGSLRPRSERYRYGRQKLQGNGERSGSGSPLHRKRAEHDTNGAYSNRGSASPLHRKRAERDTNVAYSNRSPPRHGRDFKRGRGRDKSRGLSPPHRARLPHSRRDGNRQETEVGFARGDGIHGNSRKVSPRKGDWLCSDPRCGTLNFVGRSSCYNCYKGRYEREVARPVNSSHQGYSGPRPHRPPSSFMPVLPVERASRMYVDPPPRSWRRDGPREYAAPISPRPRDRFFDPGYEMDEGYYLVYRGVREFDRSPSPYWIPRNNGRGEFPRRRELNDGSNTGLLPYPLLPHLRASLLNSARERSRSPPRRVLKRRRMDSHSRGHPQIGERRMMITNY